MWYAIAFFAGFMFGVFVMALMCANRMNDCNE